MARSRTHELDEELDETFLEFLHTNGVTGTIRQTANDARRTVTFYWIEQDDAESIDVSDFPTFLSFADAKLYSRAYGPRDF